MTPTALRDAIIALARSIAKKSTSPQVDQWALDLETLAAQITLITPTIFERRLDGDRRIKDDANMPHGRRGGQRRRTAPKQSAIVQTVGIDVQTNLIVGQTAQATATGFQSVSLTVGNTSAVPVPGVTFTWASTDAGIASVNSSGLITAVSAGTCDITATAPNGRVGTVSMSITAAVPVLTTAVVSAIDQVIIGSTYQAEATGYDENGQVLAGVVWTWTTSNASIATVNSTTGLITPVAAGDCDITATSGAVSDAETITVVTPTPTTTSVTVSPDGATIVPSAQLQFSLVANRSDGSTAQVPGASVSWSETGGGSINASGLYTAGASPESVTVTGTYDGQSDNAALTIANPGVQPSQYDPARLGSDLIIGQNFNVVSVGASISEIIASLNAVNQGGFSSYPLPGSGQPNGLSPNNLTTGQVTCIPNDAFGKVMRVCFPGPSKQGTMFNFAQLTSSVGASLYSSDWYFSCIMRLNGNGCVNGFAPPGYPNASLYPNGYYTSYGSGVAGGSTTHKLMFAFPVSGGGRYEMVIMNSGYLNLGVGNVESGKVETRWTGKGTAGVNDFLITSAGGTNFPWTSTEAGAVYRGDQEFYQYVERFKQISSTSYIVGYYHRKLTSGAGTVLLSTPGNWRFIGWDVTNAASWQYNRWQPLGNKSQSNDGPNDMYIDIAAFEVVRGDTTQEPYATLHGFGNHL